MHRGVFRVYELESRLSTNGVVWMAVVLTYVFAICK